jgi:glycosyltransferase involved in cell wall biosynthesis
MIDVVIPAHNESDTVAGVVQAAKGSQRVGEVIVVADACHDDTAEKAESVGAVVVECSHHDKGSAMAEGLQYVSTPLVCFLDADLEGFTPLAFSQLASYAGPSVMVVGTRGMSQALRQTVRIRGIPPVGGERICPTWLAVKADLWKQGYRSEMRLSTLAIRSNIRIVEVTLPYVRHRTTSEKQPDPLNFHAKRWLAVGTEYIDYLLRPRRPSRPPR